MNEVPVRICPNNGCLPVPMGAYLVKGILSPHAAVERLLLKRRQVPDDVYKPAPVCCATRQCN